MRTTIDIEAPLLEEIRAIQQQDGRSMGRIVSQLLAEALASRKRPIEPAHLEWRTRPMAARVDLNDKEAVHALLTLTSLPSFSSTVSRLSTPATAISAASGFWM